MVLLRLKKIGFAVSPQAGAHRRDKNAGSIFEQREALAPKGRGPRDGPSNRCEGMTIQGGIVLPDPWPEGIRRGLPAGAIFRREPGLQRGRRRAPFARSREMSAHIKTALWRTERIHRPGISLSPVFSQNVNSGCATLTHPTILG
ncbi:hypothetical protein CDT92_17950 [Cronobacter sakazakii]|nr:hypothetical protein CDT87_17835 [Cronobacter sakazakii]PQV94011.1 hypothetical protein CDT93_02075 [Cronobacter sakazakii]PQX92521.1 hypothetical protein C5940_12600 [Cronobacter sakazakii]PUV61054.1 hypothetical protein CDT92_17950 [Cronobacter sakazakii]